MCTAHAINFISNLIPGGFPKGHLFAYTARMLQQRPCGTTPYIMNGIGEILHCNRSGATDAIICETRNKILSLTRARSALAGGSMCSQDIILVLYYILYIVLRRTGRVWVIGGRGTFT